MDTNKIIELSKKAIAIQSTTTHSSSLEEILELFLRQFKNNPSVKVQQFCNEGKPCATIQSKLMEPKIWLNAHLDVVPGNKNLFAPKLQNAKLFGRGALDMKTEAVCFTLLTNKLIASGCNMGLMLVTDEEVGGHDGTKFLLDQKIVKPEFVIVGEPSDLEVGTESKGIISIDIVSHGISAHGSKPWLGKNAILAVLKPIQELQRKFPIPIKDSWKTTINIGIFHGGAAVNQVPNVCSIKLDVRFIPSDNPQMIIKEIKSIFKHQEVLIKMIEPPIFSDKANPFILNFFGVVKEVLKVKPIFRKGHESSDIRFFTQKHIPAVTFGLKGEGLHAEHEWVSIKEIGAYITILEKFLIKNCI